MILTGDPVIDRELYTDALNNAIADVFNFLQKNPKCKHDACFNDILNDLRKAHHESRFYDDRTHRDHWDMLMAKAEDILQKSEDISVFISSYLSDEFRERLKNAAIFYEMTLMDFYVIIPDDDEEPKIKSDDIIYQKVIISSKDFLRKKIKEEIAISKIIKSKEEYDFEVICKFFENYFVKYRNDKRAIYFKAKGFDRPVAAVYIDTDD